MLNPPFKRAGLLHDAAACCDGPARTDAPGRGRLTQLDPQLHCSIIGTCLGTAELRRLMARFVVVDGASDLEVHHDAVKLASQGGDAARALHKALEQRHAASVRSFGAAQDEVALGAAWDAAMRQGEIPGAYWALLTHRQVTPALRQRAFGEVHMLSHLVGAANRADIRRLVALEQDNAALADRLEREQQRRQAALAERDAIAARLQQQALDFERRAAGLRAPEAAAAPDPAAIALHAKRREHAEQAAATARQALEQLQQEFAQLNLHAAALTQELGAAESALQSVEAEAGAAPGAGLLGAQLRQRRILYVGGRPASMPAIRALVQRHGGELLHHDGGLEVRKGLLAAAVPQADLVVFPVDCIDHDSALQLKRLSERHGIGFVALRNASVTSFAAALAARERLQ